MNYDATKKFKDSLVAKLPWTKLCVRLTVNLHIIKCKICNEVEGKDKLMFHKWDYFLKHANHKKVEKYVGTNLKKRD
jgi:hypothetical protein